jgi:hypothetical protein
VSYTVLRVAPGGVVLYHEHARRLAPAGDAVLEAFRAFTRAAAPGIYALRAANGRLSIDRREESRLRDGMPVRFAVSPFASRLGCFPKPAPPSPYDAARLSGVCTLLTSIDGAEILEACSAAVVGWDGRRLLFPPADRPRVASTAEAALRARAEFTEAPILSRSGQPMAVVNAAKGLCLIQLPDRDEFPPAGRRAVETALAASVVRP